MKTYHVEREKRGADSGAAPCSAICEQDLNKMDACRHLLPDPGSQVAGQLIAEVRRLRLALERIRSFPVHSEPLGGAYAMQDIAHETLSPNNTQFA